MPCSLLIPPATIEERALRDAQTPLLKRQKRQEDRYGARGSSMPVSLATEAIDAKGRRKRRKKRHKHGKGRRRKHHNKKCKPNSTAKT